MGHVKGGLAVATTIASGLFAACCGSSTAEAVAMGKITYPQMKRYNYDDKISSGVLAAGGTVGILIPPSTAFIVIGILTELSIGKLFLAGIIPGITQVVFYVITIAIVCRINPSLGPPSDKMSTREKLASLRKPWPIVLLFLLVIGGIYGGIFTPTEAGGVGAFGALVIALAMRQVTKQNFAECLADAAKVTAMIMAMIIGAFVYNKFIALTRITFVLGDFIIALGLSKILVLLLIVIIYLILGCFFDVYAMVVLTVPIFFPIITALGFNPIWYSVIMVRLMEIGLITPPFGMNDFVIAGVLNMPVGTVYRGVLLFLIADMLNLALLIAVPSLSTLLPSMMIATSK